MTNEDLIKSIIKLYADARQAVKGFADPGIIRGRKHSISSMAEDVLSYFLLQRLDETQTELWVDYPISFRSQTEKTKKGNPKSITIYPDICVIKKQNGVATIQSFIDLKMDLGWKRNLYDNLVQNKVKEKVQQLRSIKHATYKPISENGKKKRRKTGIRFRRVLLACGNYEWEKHYRKSVSG